MRALSIRDVIGPVMVGPSSSHTAGALRLALMCRNLLSAPPARVSFRLYGSFAHTYRGHGTDRALVAGMLGFAPDDLHIRDSFDCAAHAGLEFSFEQREDMAGIVHPNTVCIDVVDVHGVETSMRGESIGGGAAQITRINGIDVQLSGEYSSIVVRQLDRRGVLAHIARCLSDSGVNIATTRLFRKKKGETAYTVIEADGDIPSEVVSALLDNPNIEDVRIVERDSAAAADDEAAALLPACTEAQAADAVFEQVDFATAASLLDYCEREGVPISEAFLRRERALLAVQGAEHDGTHAYLHRALAIMRASATGPLAEPASSMGGLIGGEASKLSALHVHGGGVLDGLSARACAYAAAVLETNASMGRIVAAPTAGSAGVLPAALFACQDIHGFTDDELELALANAAAIGTFVMRNATVSGAEGGCQAEVGTASAMAASAVVELMGGGPAQCLAAASNALVGLMGLVCDPVGGLVELPCQKRNVTGVVNALASAQTALAGIDNLVDFDQTVEAMHHVGSVLPFELRESALGGLAATPAACAHCPSR